VPELSGGGEAMLAAFAILVEFTVKPGQADRFRKLVVANAEQSLRDEPGCRRFDVLDDPADPQRIVLYEIYRDAAAFDLHLEAAHYKSFAAAVESLVEAKSIRRLTPVSETPERTGSANRTSQSNDNSRSETAY
jgi:quinol monooxygenase YgiN